MKLLFENWRQYLKEGAEGPDFGRVILTAQAGDDFEVRVKVPVTHAGIKVFTPGRAYKGKVKKNGTDIVIQRNSFNFFDTDPDARGATEMTKKEFIEILEEKAKEEDKEPCEIVNCEKSIIIRGDKRKTFSEYLKNPTFEKAPEPIIKPAPMPEIEPEPTIKPAPMPEIDPTPPEVPQGGDSQFMQTQKEIELCMAYPNHYRACFKSLVDQGYQPAMELEKQLGRENK